MDLSGVAIQCTRIGGCHRIQLASRYGKDIPGVNGKSAAKELYTKRIWDRLIKNKCKLKPYKWSIGLTKMAQYHANQLALVPFHKR